MLSSKQMNFRTQSWSGQWPIWSLAKEKTRQNWLQKHEPSVSPRWGPATAMLSRYRLSLIENFPDFTIPMQAGRLQYTCKYTADDLKKTLGQVQLSERISLWSNLSAALKYQDADSNLFTGQLFGWKLQLFNDSRSLQTTQLWPLLWLKWRHWLGLR